MHTDQSKTPAPEGDQKPPISSHDEPGKASEDETLKKMMFFMETLLKEIEKDEQKKSQTNKS
jgi:hypothetical protein